MLTIGQTYTTAASGITGTVAEIVPNPKGDTSRVRLVLDDDTIKWTTVIHKGA
jgi:hypothetical protein